MKILSGLSLCSIILLTGCVKDKNADDYRRDQVQQMTSRITAASGSYTGSAISKIDGSNLGAMNLKFQARTDIQPSSSATVTNEQNVIVSGSLSFKSITSAEIAFDNGYYDNVSGVFQVTIPITLDGGVSSKLFLDGTVSGDKWAGSIEVTGQPKYGAALDLTRNAPTPNTSAIEVAGTRLQQIQKTNFTFAGFYDLAGEKNPIKVTFIDRNILPEQNFYKLFSPVRYININLNFIDFELNYSNAILDDQAGTLTAHDPTDEKGAPARAALNCTKYNQVNSSEFGWDCVLQTKATTLNLHLPVAK